MKSILCCLFLLFTLGLKASNDTLTRVQVYNFNVGDTFDYKIESKDGTLNNQPGITFDLISFQRLVIIQARYFSAIDSFFIVEEIYNTPNPTLPNDTFAFQRYDTLQMDSTFKYAFFDAPNYCGISICSLTTDTGYNQRIVNTAIDCGGLGCSIDNTSYAAGLGMVYSYSSGGDGVSSWSSIGYNLIYYSQNGEKWGIPGTIALSITNVPEQKPVISLFPTVNNGHFKIKISDSEYQNCQLVVYDLAGREIKRTTLDKSVSDIDIEGASAGMYLWRVINAGQTLQSGKLVVQ